ncbi:alpha/beta hydrolase [Oenococcus sicerae]|uniref:Alpha/beta hydrolase n=1 Tax=Oenococcus sicerae TaxID=2203724 RepID=A0AAJ1RCV0_9LACO|nr:alpha/beta hydrolase [Oenococcus sicerae]MDN6900630.1 alpha/beta hydrolase [Oenococcus sicerae]
MLRWLTRIVIAMLVLYLAACAYFFSVAELRNTQNDKNYTTVGVPASLKSDVADFQQRYEATGRKVTLKHDALKLDAYYLPAQKTTNKTVIVIHGFRRNKSGMKAYADMFAKLGYNTLTVDNRGHGQSQGHYVGFGWLDKSDIEAWIRYLVAKNAKVEIVPFGISMGGATVAMMSGDQLPVNVKALIEDSGYTSAEAEIAYQGKEMYNLPAKPIVPTVSLISKIFAGYSYAQADTLAQIRKNTRPMLFMHGGADSYVPTKMVYQLYKADPDSRKRLWIAANSGHVQGFGDHPAAYMTQIKQFLNLYFK